MITKLGLLAMSWLLLSAMQPPPKPAPPQLAMWRLDCGRIVEEARRPLPWKKQDLPVGCYLIQHGKDYMLWDAGLSARALGNAHPTLKLDRSIADQLKQIGVRPEDVGYVGISHYHGDHTGQAANFRKARLLIGAADLAALKGATPPQGSAPTHLAPWIGGGAPVTELTEDHDLFGDGSIMVLMTPGHTPGHLSLLVKLAGRPVMLSGDLWATHADVLSDDTPPFNSSHAETYASRERFRRILLRHDAVAILQHEAADVDKLPPFPQAAR